MTTERRRWLAAAAGIVGAIAFATLTGTIRWGGALECGIFGQYALGPVCASPELVTAIGVIGVVLFFVLWPRPGSGSKA